MNTVLSLISVPSMVSFYGSIICTCSGYECGLYSINYFFSICHLTNLSNSNLKSEVKIIYTKLIQKLRFSRDIFILSPN